MKNSFTPEQLIRIREAYDKAYAYLHGDNPSGQLLIAELQKPEPRFEDGQVVYTQYLEDDQPTGDYFVVDSNEPNDVNRSSRPLNQTECGPFPKAMYEALKRVSMRREYGHSDETDILMHLAEQVLSQMPEGWDD